jgi:hypothetical protein
LYFCTRKASKLSGKLSGELILFVFFAQLSPTSTLPALADKLYKAALDRTARHSVYYSVYCSVYYSVYLLY